MSRRRTNDERPEDTLGPPPPYSWVCPPPYSDHAPQPDPDRSSEDDLDPEAEAGTVLLAGESEGARGGPEESEEKKRRDSRIKKMIVDLRRDGGIDDITPEEIEMMDVGFDDVLPDSEVTSLHSSTGDAPTSASAAAAAVASLSEPKATGEGTLGRDHRDASIMRLSRRLSMAELQDITLTEDTRNNGDTNDVDHPEGGADIESGEQEPKKTGIMGLLAGSSTRIMIVAFSVIFCLGLLLLVTLLPLSFVYVEYHEYALSRNGVTGSVDYGTVYDSGCYLLAPQDKLIRFKATAHSMSQHLDIMDVTGLTIGLSFSLQYFLKRDEIPQLYQKYLHDYDQVMYSIVESQVKNLAVGFTLDQYRLHRQEVEAAILKRVKYALSGDCCDPCCPDKCGRRQVKCDASTCRPQGQCHPGYHVKVRHFQLGAITIPEVLMNRLLQKVVLEVEADREYYFQEKSVEVKRTEQILQDILNQAEERRQEARATERFLLAQAEADRLKKVEQARQNALKQVFSRFNITREEVKLSYIYAHALAEKRDDIHYVHAYDGLSAMSP